MSENCMNITNFQPSFAIAQLYAQQLGYLFDMNSVNHCLKMYLLSRKATIAEVVMQNVLTIPLYTKLSIEYYFFKIMRYSYKGSRNRLWSTPNLNPLSGTQLVTKIKQRISRFPKVSKMSWLAQLQSIAKIIYTNCYYAKLCIYSNFKSQRQISQKSVFTYLLEDCHEKIDEIIVLVKCQEYHHCYNKHQDYLQKVMHFLFYGLIWNIISF